ncbi:MAG: hypothetical protein ACE5ER_13145, partial [Nitrospinaceae bacterium]
NVDRELLEVCLVDNGYVRSHMVEERGQFSLRGDILDLYLPAGAHPVRLEFFGDEVESVRHFDVTSQISFEEIEQVDILPVREICLTDKQNEAGLQRLREFAEQAGPGLTEFDEIIEKIECLKTFSGIEWLAPFFYEESTTLFDYMSSDTLLVLDEPDRIQEKVEAYHGLILEEYSRRQAAGALAAPPDTLFLDPDRWQTLCKERVVLELTGLQLNEESRADRAAFDVKPLPG